MDDAGTEHPDGWVLVDAEIVAVGGGGAGRASERLPPDRLLGRGDRTRPRQHAPPPVPDPHAGAAQEPTSSRGSSSCIRSGSGSTPRPSTPPRGRVSPSSRSPAARRSSTTTFPGGSYRDHRGRGAGGPSSACGSSPRAVDGPRRLAEAAGPTARRKPRRDPRRHRAPPRHAARGRPGSAHPARRGAVLSVSSRPGSSRSRPRSPAGSACSCTRTSPRRSRRRRTAGAARPQPGGVPRAPRLARTTSCAPTASTSRGTRSSGSARRGWVSPTARPRTSGSARASPPCGRSSGEPAGLGVDGSASNERGDLLAEVKQALLVAAATTGARP